jgi:hypothetical protein
MKKAIEVLVIVALIIAILCMTLWVMAGSGRYQVLDKANKEYVIRIDNLAGKIQYIAPNGSIVTHDLKEEK